MTWLHVAAPFWGLVIVGTAVVSGVWSVIRRLKRRSTPVVRP